MNTHTFEQQKKVSRLFRHTKKTLFLRYLQILISFSLSAFFVDAVIAAGLAHFVKLKPKSQKNWKEKWEKQIRYSSENFKNWTIPLMCYGCILKGISMQCT